MPRTSAQFSPTNSDGLGARRLGAASSDVVFDYFEPATHYAEVFETLHQAAHAA